MTHKAILLVDDDEDDRHIFSEALRDIDAGLICVMAQNGLEALLQLDTMVPEPSLIFLDLNMPLINGFDCLQKIRQEKKLTTPVVIFTTSDNPADKRKAFRDGAQYFLTKSGDFKELKQNLLQILETDFDLK